MAGSEQYEIWFTMQVTHAYYKREENLVRLKPQWDTELFFRNNRVLCRKISGSVWSFWAQSLPIEENETGNLKFELVPQTKLLYHTTEVTPPPGKEYTIEKSAETGKWIEISVPLRQARGKIHITLNTKAKYWEYIIVPKYSVHKMKLKLQEKRGLIQFKEMERASCLNLENAFHITSQHTIDMKEHYDYTIQLIEIKDKGERVVCSALPFPQPDEPSVISPYDTITTYYYI